MNSDMKKAALILTVGMVLSALILLLAAHLVSIRVTRALVAAGKAARSPAVGFPSSLKVQLREPAAPLKPEDRERLTRLFVKTVEAAKSKDGRTIKQVVVTSLEAPPESTFLYLKGTLTFETPEETVEFESYLYPDRFGDYVGFVGAKDGGARRILDGVRIRRSGPVG
jgi:hypothetical protein